MTQATQGHEASLRPQVGLAVARSMLMRIDLLLVERGLAPTRSAAQRLIEAGAVRWRAHALAPWQAPRKSGDDLLAQCEVEVTNHDELRWVSRAGLKLEGALKHSGLTAQGAWCLDVGQSTGGFTEVLLAQGARHVVGVDVGHGQLHARLRADPRVTCFEGVNARGLDAMDWAALGHPRFTLVVADLSFISLTLVLPALAPRMQQDALLLVKPQFELQPHQIGKGGLVTDASLHKVVRQRIEAACREAALPVVDYFQSPITGGDGNQEFFVQLRRTPL